MQSYILAYSGLKEKPSVGLKFSAGGTLISAFAVSQCGCMCQQTFLVGQLKRCICLSTQWQYIARAPTTQATAAFVITDLLACTTGPNVDWADCVAKELAVHPHHLIIYPLTARVVGALQMISQPVFSIFPCSPLPLGPVELQACPFADVVFPPLPLSALSSSPFHCALHNGFGLT